MVRQTPNMSRKLWGTLRSGQRKEGVDIPVGGLRSGDGRGEETSVARAWRGEGGLVSHFTGLSLEWGRRLFAWAVDSGPLIKRTLTQISV